MSTFAKVILPDNKDFISHNGLMLTYLLVLLFFFSCSGQGIKQTKRNLSISPVKKNFEGYGPTTKNGKTQFIDKAHQYGIKNITATSMAAVDLNLDGRSDLVFIENNFGQAKFYLFDSKTNKFNKSKNLFSETVESSYLVFTDFNNDGITDVLSGVLNQRTELSPKGLRLFYGKVIKGLIHFKEAKSFIDIPPSPASSVGLIDYNLDGYLDIFIGNWLDQKSKVIRPVSDKLYAYDKGEYVDRSKLLIDENDTKKNGPNPRARPTYGVQICDIDKNGLPDILTTSTNGFGNRLWMSISNSRTGKISFRDFGKVSGFSSDAEGNLTTMGGGRSFGLACADYNNDGLMDIFLGETFHAYDSDQVDKSSVLTGATFKFPPNFLRTEYTLEDMDRSTSQSDKRAIWFDYNNDGLIDLLVENTGHPPDSRLLLFKQYPDHSFENISDKLGIDIINPKSTIVLDLNKDGLLDIITSQSSLRDPNITERTYVFINRGEKAFEKKKSLHIKNKAVKFILKGSKSNKDGLNALVELKLEKKDGTIVRQTQNVSPSYGGLNPQNESGVHFGIGSDSKIISVKVKWPFRENKANEKRGPLEKSYNLLPFNRSELRKKSYRELILFDNGKIEDK